MWAPQANWLLGASSNGCSLNTCQRLFRREAEHCLSKDLVATGRLSVHLPTPPLQRTSAPAQTHIPHFTAEPAVGLTPLLKRQL